MVSEIKNLDDALEESKAKMDEGILALTGKKPNPPKEPDDKKEEKKEGKKEEKKEEGKGGSSAGSEGAPKENKKNNAEYVCNGITDPYGDLKPKPQPKSGKGGSSGSTPPARGKNDIKVSDGKDPMEVLWKEMWKLIDTLLDLGVDIVLDFAVFVLYPKSSSNSGSVDEKPDAFAAGRQVQEKKTEKIGKQKNRTLTLYNEIKDNLQRAIDGADLEWKELKTEPYFFKQLLEAKKKAISDPHSKEAELIKKFDKSPEIIEKIAQNCEKIANVAINLATLEEFLNPQTKDDEIKTAKEKYKNQPDELKKKLKEIEDFYKSPKKIQEKMAERITARSNEYYGHIIDNINQITENNADNPEKIKEEIAKYTSSINKPLKEAVDLVYEKMYKEGKDDKKNKEAAAEKIAEVLTAIDAGSTKQNEGDKIEKLQKMANILAAMEEYLEPSAKNKEIEEAKKAYTGKELDKKLKEIEKDYKDPETRKKKTSQRIEKRAEERRKKIQENIDEIEKKFKDDPEKKKENLDKYAEQVMGVLKKTRTEVYKKKYSGKGDVDLLDEELAKLKEKPEASDNDINIEKWSTDSMLRFLKSNAGLNK